MIRIHRTALFALVIGRIVSPLHAEDWPSFRGPAGNGISGEANVPTEWNADENVQWKVALPRPANGSPIVSNGRVFVTSAEDANGRQRSLYCFDRRDGEQLWSHTVAFDKQMPTHKTNPYCGSTPAANGDVVVVWHSSADWYVSISKARKFGDETSASLNIFGDTAPRR